MNDFPSTLSDLIVLVIGVIIVCFCFEGICWLAMEVLRFIAQFSGGW